MKLDFKLKSKKEVLDHLNKSQTQVKKIIGKLDINNWTTVHKEIELAISEIESARRLLAKGYIVYSLVHENIQEVVKTYKYLQ